MLIYLNIEVGANDSSSFVLQFKEIASPAERAFFPYKSTNGQGMPAHVLYTWRKNNASLFVTIVAEI